MSDTGPAHSEVRAVGDALRVTVLAANRFQYALAREHDIGIRDAALLAILHDAGGQLTPGVLAEQLLVTSGTLTAIVRRLEQRKLLARTPDPDDRRGTLVTLQPAGRRATERAAAHLDAVAAQLAAELAPGSFADQLRAAATALTVRTRTISS